MVWIGVGVGYTRVRSTSIIFGSPNERNRYKINIYDMYKVGFILISLLGQVSTTSSMLFSALSHFFGS